MDKNFNDIYNDMRNLGGKSADGMSDSGQQVSVTAQENVNLTAFLFHHRLRCTLDWEVTGMHEGTMHGCHQRISEIALWFYECIACTCFKKEHNS